MLRLNILLGIILLGSVAFGQTAEIENGEGGESVRTKLNEDINKGNDHADTIPVLRIDINKNVDTLQDIRIDVNAKLPITDTTAMLVPYILESEIDLTASDTATMLTPYITRGDTASMLTPYILESEIDLTASDTAAMLVPYILESEIDLTASDTATMLAPYATDDTTDQIRLDLNAEIALSADTSAAQRVDINDNSDSITIHRDDLALLIAKVSSLEDSVYTIQPTDATLLVYYDFEDDLEDNSINNNTGAEINKFSFSFYDISLAGQSTIADLFSDSAGFSTPSINFGSNRGALGFDLAVGTTNEPYRFAAGIEGEIEFIVNPSDSTVSIITFSSPTDSAILVTPAGSFEVSYSMHQFMFTWNRSQGTGVIYIDGVDAGATGSVKTDFAVSGVIYAGMTSTQQHYVFAGMDEFRTYSGDFKALDASNLYALDPFFYEAPVAAPILQSAKATDTRLTLTFDIELLDGDSANVITGLDYEANNVDVPIDSFVVATNDLICYTDSVFNGDALTITYTNQGSGGIQSLLTVELATIDSDSSVTNNVCDPIQYFHAKFNNNLTEELGNVTISVYSGTAEYTTHASFVAEGTHAFLNNAGLLPRIQLESPVFGDKFTLAGWVHDINSSANKVIFSNMDLNGTDGIELSINPNKKLVLETRSGGAIDSAYSIIDFPRGDKEHFAFTVDKEEGRAMLFINGVKSTADSAILSTFTTTGNYSILSNRNSFESVIGGADDWQGYTGIVPDDSITSIMNNPGRLYTGCGDPGDPPNPITDDFPTYADSILVVTFENTPLGDYSLSQADTDFTQRTGTDATYAIGLGEEGFANNVQIVTVPAVTNGSETRALKITHKADKAGQQRGGGLGSGAAIHVDLSDGYTDLEISYNILLKQNTDFQINGKFPSLRGGVDGDDSSWKGTINFFGPEANIYPFNGGLVWYVYYANAAKSSQYGGYWTNTDGSYFQFDTSTLRWYNIIMRWSLNDEGVNNGVYEAWVDGNMVSQNSNLNLSDVKIAAGDMDIDFFILNYFYGGNTTELPNFAPETDQHVHIDDIHIFFLKSTESQPASNEPSEAGRIRTKIPGWNYDTGEKVERTTDH